jgi:hypothetical protein
MNGVKTELLVWRLDRRLRRDVTYGRRRAIRRDVRANVGAAAQDLGEAEAIRRLGDIDELAAEYRAAAGRGQSSFRPDSGIRAVVWTTLALLVITFVRVPTFGMVDTFDAFTGEQQWEWGVRYLWSFHGDIRTSTLFEGSVYWTVFVVFGSAAFLLWSRAWRLLRPRGEGLGGHRVTP